MITRNQKSILFAIIHLGIALIFGMFFFKPLINRFKETYSKVKEVNRNREIVYGTVLSIPEMNKEKTILEERLKLLNRRLPSKDKISSIISQMSEKTGDLNVKILSVSYGDEMEVEGKPVLKKPIVINMESDLKTLAEYLNLIEEIDTALAIKKVYLNKKLNLNPPVLFVQIQVETYISSENTN